MKTMRPLLLVLLWCHSPLLMSCVTLPEATPPMGISQRLDTVMTVFVDRTGFNGVVLVSDAGKVVYQKAFGYANMEWKVANTTDTRFKLASLGKQFTALLIMQLVKAGKLELNDLLTKYVPEVSARNADRITIRELLNHTSGYPTTT
jgi:CubicO group peptidase (beta-lactamase class C family)